jgi:hypothetical protein
MFGSAAVAPVECWLVVVLLLQLVRLLVPVCCCQVLLVLAYATG